MALVPVQNLYDAFFVLIESDEWNVWEESAVENDLMHLAMAAIPWFKFPRCSLEWDDSVEFFIDERIGNTELQIIASFMKIIWYGRVIDSWENLRPMYTERDFSPSAQLKIFEGRQINLRKMAKELEGVYYRSINSKPYNYKRFAGGN